MKEWLARGALIAAGLALGLIGVELFLRLFLPQPLNVIRVRPDGVLSHVPSLDIVLVSTETRARVRTNRDGLRDVERPRAKPPGVTRVLVVGDSMIEGLQVELPLTMPKQLEHRLEAALPERRFDVVNAGVSGSAGPQALRYLERDGLSLDPDLVVTAITTRNDVHEAAEDQDRELPRAYELRIRLRSRFHLYGLAEGALNASPWLRNAVASVGLVGPAEPAPASEGDIVIVISDEAYLYDERPSAFEARGYGRLFEAYDGIVALCGARDIPVLFLVIPSYFQATRYAAALGNPALVGKVVRNDRAPQERLLVFFRDRGVPALDLLPALRETAEAYYLPADQHFNAAGHALVAERAARVILDEGLLQRAP
jgi:lysophospholipase L1-like esterase